MLGTSIAYRNFLITLFRPFHFISRVYIWFISYIINSHFFHGNIWTHNWPAPNVSGFIAQLVEHRTGIARSRVQAPLKSWIFFFQASLRNCINCVHCDYNFFIFTSFPQFIYDLFHILGVPSGKCQSTILYLPTRRIRLSFVECAYSDLLS